VWLRLFGSAEREIGILTNTAQPLAGHPGVLTVLAEKAAVSGVRVRICLPTPEALAVAQRATMEESRAALKANVRMALASLAPLHEKGQVEIRLHRAIVYNAIYYADDELLVSHHAQGIPAANAPVIHLRRDKDGDMLSVYLASFADVWVRARSLD
jgi:hypothetical protein